jgi:hypothetical protein
MQYTRRFEQRAHNLKGEGLIEVGVEGPEVTSYNKITSTVERAFIGEGLHLRPWYKNVIVAPGYYEGYAAQAFPDWAFAIQTNNSALASQAVSVLTASIEKAHVMLSFQPPKPKGPLSAGAIAGIIIGSLGAVASMNFSCAILF